MTGFNIHPAAIINQIKNLLKERYKEGFPIVKEIIQNANDGGATKLDFGVTLGLGDRVEHPLLKSSALFFVNNGHFSDTDEQAITYIGIDSNARDGSKIGKFGLGQKSVFHFCEAYFFIARSPTIPEGCGRFLNPWASGIDKDIKRPDWNALSPQDRQQIAKFLIQKGLIKREQEKYFVLWIPLRQQQPDNRCILANYYDENSIQAQLPPDMASKISLLLPLLKHLESVSYWIPEKNGDLTRKFHVCLESNNLQRCLYPQKDKSNQIEIQRNLCGSITIDSLQHSSSLKFTGQESIIGHNNFKSLLGDQTQIPENFWTTLQQSPYWSKREAIDERGDTYNVPDKSIPHCAVVFSQNETRVDRAAKLSIQWAVFLPLASDCDREEFEEHDCPGDRDYSLVLHGYFFLDSGRTSIEALRSIREGTIPERVPNNEEEMVQQWNRILATEGTLKQIIPALEQFVQTHNFNEAEISNLCQSLKQSRIFQSTSFQESIYAEYQWVYCIKPTGSTWEKLTIQDRVLSIPETIPDWEIFSGFKQIADKYPVTLSDKSNLQCNKNNNERWNEEDVFIVIESIEVQKVFTNSKYIDYFTNFLNHVYFRDRHPYNIQGESKIEYKLIELLREVFASLDNEIICSNQKSLQNLFSLIPSNKIIFLDNKQSIFAQIAKLPLKILIAPQIFKNTDNSGNIQISYKDVEAILKFLADRFKGNSEDLNLAKSYLIIIEQLINSTDNYLLEFIERNPDSKVIIAYNALTEKNEILSFKEIGRIKERKILFKNLQNGLHYLLQKALHKSSDCAVTLVDPIYERLFKAIYHQSLAECNYEICLQVLTNKPELSSEKDRAELLKAVIKNI